MAKLPEVIIAEVDITDLPPKAAKERIDAIRKELTPKLEAVGVPVIFVSAKNGIPALKLTLIVL